MLRRYWVLGALCSSLPSYAQVQVGAGSYATSGAFSVPATTPYVTTDFNRLTASATWWSSLISNPLSQSMFPHPLSARAVTAGLELGNPGTLQSSATDIVSPHRADLTVGVAALNSTTARVTTYSHWSVTARWQDGVRQLEATMGHGFPFAYFKVTGGNASVALGAGAVIWHRQNETIGVSVGGRPYAVFAPTGAVWTGTGPLVSTLAGRDYLSVAALPDTTSATLAFFKRYASVFG